MSEALYPYYERELGFIRHLAQEFARQYPAAAGRLLLEANRSVDPHIERMIEAFALLSARVQHKLDDEFPELTDALLNILYPHYLAPIPSLGIVQFDPDPGRAPLTQGFLIHRGSMLHTPPVHNLPCKFRTCYPVHLWPIEVAEARLQPPPFPRSLQPPRGAVAALYLELHCQAGLNFASLSLDSLRLYLGGQSGLMAHLYELLFNNVIEVVLRPAGSGSGSTKKVPSVVLPPSRFLHQVGFDAEDALLPYPRQSFPGYRLLSEFFCFPEKFLFVDLRELHRICKPEFGNRVEIVFFLSKSEEQLEQSVEAQTFRLGCTPVINLFEQTAEPIALNHTKHEYRIVPDVAHPFGMEVYSVDEVISADPTVGQQTQYLPFYSYRHGATVETHQTFWYSSRRPASRENDQGTDVYLSLVDLGFNPHVPTESALIVRTTCTNRDFPSILRRAGDQIHLELEAAAPLARIRCVRTPTVPLRPPMRRGAYWRLISHLSLNHLSLEEVHGREALQEILRLYDFSTPESGHSLAAITRQLIDGISNVSSRRVVGRTGTAPAAGFCRGVEISIEFNEEKYVGTGVYLFASVLERFLGLYASVNSFSQLVARTRQGEGILKRWPPRAGEQHLL